MKRTPNMLILACSAALAGCAYVPLKEGAVRRVSVDYRAAGAMENAEAFVYGNRTILRVGKFPVLLMVRDEDGETVGYERIGDHYRLADRLEKFTAWINGRPVTFEAIPATRVFSSSLPVIKPADPVDSALMAILQLSAQQLLTVRKQVKDNILWKGMEARYWPPRSSTVWVNFPENSVNLSLDKEFSKTLVEAAKNAETIILRGRTDAVIAGSMDGEIARNRALAARSFLVKNGIKANKIRVLSKAAGDFLVPNDTNEGRALNRRVEIEISNTRITALKQSSPLQGGFASAS